MEFWIAKSYSDPLQVDVVVNHQAFRGTSLSFCLLYLMLNLCLVKLRDLRMQSLDDILGNLVGAESHTELVLCAVNHVDERLLNVIVNLVHAKV